MKKYNLDALLRKSSWGAVAFLATAAGLWIGGPDRPAWAADGVQIDVASMASDESGAPVLRLDHGLAQPVTVWMKTGGKDWAQYMSLPMGEFDIPLPASEPMAWFTFSTGSDQIAFPELLALQWAAAAGGDTGSGSGSGSGSDGTGDGWTAWESGAPPTLADASMWVAATDAAGNNHATATPDPGRLKMYWHNQSSGQVAGWILKATGVLKSSGDVYPSGSISSAWRLAGIGDINRDGVYDLVWHNQTSGLVAYWMLAADCFMESSGLVHGTPISTAWRLAGCGDIDGDHTADLIWHNQTTALVAYWMLNSNGSLRTSGMVHSNSISTAWNLSGVGDVDRDGTTDLVWHNQSSGLVAYWMLKTNGTLKTSGLVHSSPISTAWRLGAMGDIDRDSTPDLMWHNQSSGLAAYWTLNANGTLKTNGLVRPTAIATTWTLSASGDIDNDGSADMIWVNTNAGSSAFWTLNANGTLKTNGTISTSVATIWSMKGAGY